jgi:glycosyltransferase involved in cell wall biosynthesis
MRATRISISVIIPVYNGERFLAEAIQSVLDQTLPPDEIIVVNDGSTDGTATIVARLAASAPLPIRYIYQENRGASAARNAGIRLAQGRILAFQDADDIWLPQKQVRQLALLEADPPADIVTGFTQQFADAAVPPGAGLPGPLPHPYADFHLQSKLIRAAVFERVGLLDEALTFGEDLDWLVRAIQGGAVLRPHQEVVVHYRRHAGNLTNQIGLPGRYLIVALRRAAQRRRAQVAPIALPALSDQTHGS